LASNYINIACSTSINELIITNALGNVVYKGSNQPLINIDHLSAGLHFVTVVHQGKAMRAQFIKYN
jgi:hypothetical protein